MKILKIALLLALISGFAQAKMFQSVAPEQAELLQVGKSKLYCPNCGMNLIKFYKTSHAMKQHDGSTHQYCSIHCLAEANDKITGDTRVVDVSSLKFITAYYAHYVVGSKVKGTMTMNSKYAFKSKKDAEAFAKENGGKVMSFADAVQLASDDIYADNTMIKKKRTMAASKGQKMYKGMCKQDTLPAFDSIAHAKTHLVDSGICGSLKDKQYQAIAIYLTRQTGTKTAITQIKVPHDAKCPVCGMFVSKYPKWAAQINIDGYTHYFDGPKDMMKFYFEPAAYHRDAKQSMITDLLVIDYYTLKTLKAKAAWYVVGSNVYGPMGNELIPFASKEDAETFKRDHGGKEVLSFDAITESIVKALDK